MATETILPGLSVSMTEFKKNPNEALRKSGGQAVAVLSATTFYMVPPERYEAMLEAIDDMYLVCMAKGRLKQKGRAIESRWMASIISVHKAITKCDIKFRAIFEAICELMSPSDPKKKWPVDFVP